MSGLAGLSANMPRWIRRAMQWHFAFLTFAFLFLAGLPKSSALASRGNPAFKASGTLARIQGSTAQRSVFDFQFVVLNGKWSYWMRSRDYPDQLICGFFDGKNVFVVIRPESNVGEPLMASVTPGEVPYGAGRPQTLWFHFCRHAWGKWPTNHFPNLGSFHHGVGTTNLHLAAHPIAGGGLEAKLDYEYGGQLWPVEQWQISNIDPTTGVGLVSERSMFSRLGSIVRKEVIPVAGRSYTNLLERYEINVTRLTKGDFPEELTPDFIEHSTLAVNDGRFSRRGDYVSYKATNGFPSEQALRTVYPVRFEIAKLERTEKSPPTPPARAKYLAIGVTLLLAAAVWAIIYWKKGRKRQFNVTFL